MVTHASVLEVKSLRKTYDGRCVLNKVDLEVRQGETLVILGASGSGKSTLLRILVGLERPDEGSVHIWGTDIFNADKHQLSRIRRRMGMAFQSGALFGSMTVAENVALPLQEHTELDYNIISIQVKIKLELVGLREHADKYPAQISGGMKKRAGLARALALNPAGQPV